MRHEPPTGAGLAQGGTTVRAGSQGLALILYLYFLLQVGTIRFSPVRPGSSGLLSPVLPEPGQAPSSSVAPGSGRREGRHRLGLLVQGKLVTGDHSTPEECKHRQVNERGWI